MKTSIKLIFLFVVFLQANAQNEMQFLQSLYTGIELEKTFRTRQKFRIDKKTCIKILPQFGSLFSNKKADLKDRNIYKSYYSVFDFGVGLGFDYMVAKAVHLKTFYNVGLLKFRTKHLGTVQDSYLKVAINYYF